MALSPADETLGLAAILCDMAHQLRTPLNGVVGMAGVLGQTRLDPGQEQMTQVIESSGRALNAILSDVLELARLEAGQFKAEDRPFSLAEAAEALQRRLAPELLSKGAALKLRLSPRVGAAEVIGDETAVRQLLCRLVRRALASAGQGEVELSAMIGADGGVLVEIECRPSRPVAGEASGLDLAICRALAAAMGGTLQVTGEGEAGEGGCRLLLPLPLCEARAA